MVRNFLQLLSRELQSIHSAALVLGVSAVSSQLLALIRDRLFAHQFGASTTLDVYYAAFRIPDLIFVCVASLVSVSVLIPFFAHTSEKGKEETQRFLNTIFSVFSITIVAVCTAAFFLMPMLAERVVPGFSQVARSEYITFARILLLSPLLFGFSNLFSSITQFEHKFFVSAVAPLLYNLGIIAGIVLLYPIFGSNGLVYGVVIGAALHCLLQLSSVLSSGFTPKLTIKPDLLAVRSVAALSLPRTLALGAQQLVILVLVGFATSMSSGSIAVFNFALNLQSVPLSVIGISYSTAAFPTLARLFRKGATEEYVSHVAITARHMLFWLLPATSLFIVLRAQIVRTVLGSGRFDWTDTRLTAALLALFALSLAAQSLVLLFTRAYYAASSTKKPLLMNIGVAFLTVILAVLFEKCFMIFPEFRTGIESMLRVDGLPGTTVLVLPLAFSVGSILNAVLHWIVFSFEFSGFARTVLRTFAEVFVASIVIGLVSYQSLSIFASLFNLDTFVGIFLQGLISGLLGIIVGVGLLRLLANRELADLVKTLHERFWKTKPIVPGPEEQLS